MQYRPGDLSGYNEVMSQQGWFYDLADLNQSVPFAPWRSEQSCGVWQATGPRVV